MTTLLAIAGAIVALGAATVVITRALRWARSVARFVDELTGEPAAFGRPERPGLVQRLDLLQDDMSAVRHEVFANSGLSLRDGVDRVETRLDGIETRLDGIERQRPPGQTVHVHNETP